MYLLCQCLDVMFGDVIEVLNVVLLKGGCGGNGGSDNSDEIVERFSEKSKVEQLRE
jgi:hypothetical protein